MDIATPRAPAERVAQTAIDDPNRLAALRASGLLDAAPELAFDRATRLATRLLGVPVSLFSLVDAERQMFKSQIGLAGWAAEARGTPLSHSFCQHVVASGETLAVRDAREAPALCGNRAIRDLNVVAYLGIPVRDGEGNVLGSFCAIDGAPRDWTEEDIATMRDLAAIVESEIVLRRSLRDRRLLIDELHHRIKNTFALVSGMIGLNARTADTAEELADTVRARLHALGRAHEMIIPVGGGGAPGEAIPLGELIALLLAPHSRDGAEPALSGGDVGLGPRAAASLALVMHELATNAAKYGAFAAPGGRLAVDWRVEGDMLRLEWRETGVPAREAPAGESGFGTTLLRITIEDQLGGAFQASMADSGLQWEMRVPLAALER